MSRMEEKHTVKFRDTLARQYARLFAEDPDYAWVAKQRTPEDLANVMTESLIRGSGNKEGKGIARTCKELGIKHTYKALNQYFHFGGLK